MPMILPALLALSLAGGSTLALDPGDDASGQGLTLPGGPAFPVPPGLRVYPPGGIDAGAAPDPPPPAAKTEPPEKSPAERRKARIDDLFTRLARAGDETEAQAIGATLNRVWLQSGSDTADLLMSRAVAAMDGKDYKTAESILDKVVALQPGWAEGWNKRATVRYLRDDDAQSMLDIGRTLAIEPRHFGALSGMSLILHRNGQDRAAMTVLRKAAAINPQDKAVKSLIERIAPDVDGRDI